MTKITFKIEPGWFRLFGVGKYRSTLLSDFKIECSSVKLHVPTKCYRYFLVVCSDYISVFRNDTNDVNDADNVREVVVNAQTTIASIFCFSRSISLGHFTCLHAEVRVLDIEYGFKNSFISDDGFVSEVIKSNPNGLETNSYPMFNYLSSLVYYCRTDDAINESFLKLTNSCSILEGLLHLAQNPFDNVEEIYNLIKDLPSRFTPALNTLTLPSWKETLVPNQWTLTIKVNDSGSKNFLIGGPGYLVFDKKDRAWLTNNVRQGTPNSSAFCTILEPDGRPASLSPLFGGGLLGGGFGIAINDRKNKIALGNFGWGSTDYNPQEGSVSIIRSNGEILSPPNGYTNGFKRAQGLWYDRDGNLWISAWGDQAPLGGGDPPTADFPSSNSAVVVYIKGDPNNIATYEFDNEYFHTFDVIVDDDRNVYVSNAGDGSENVNSSVYHFRLIDNKIVKINSWTSTRAEGFRQINISPKGSVVVAAVLTHRVIKFDKNLNMTGEFVNTMDGPWGVGFDSIGTMYVSNFREDSAIVHPSTYDMDGVFGVTIVYDEDDSTAQIATLPTGGDEVILKSGFPLYGSAGKPSYEPLQRMTGSRVDLAGNLWAVNNWKPALMADLGGNPCGDGVVIFIGLAKPHA
jgi:hypothetical protein